MIRPALRDFAAVHLNDRLPLWRIPAITTAELAKEEEDSEVSTGNICQKYYLIGKWLHRD